MWDEKLIYHLSLGSYRTLSGHKLTLTQDFKGARDSRGEKGGPHPLGASSFQRRDGAD